jgi:hypothetical protein
MSSYKSLKMSKDISEEDMKMIREKGNRVRVKNDNIVVTAYIFNNQIYIDDIDLEEEKKSDKPEPKKEFSHKHSQDLNSDEEIDGNILKSIISSKLKLRDMGMGLDCILLINRHIEGIAASLWSHIPLQIRSMEGDKDSEKTLDLLDKQFCKQLDDFFGLAEEFTKQAKEQN